jgi:hypothetical protein
MTMSQSGGFILTGIKLDPEAGRNELDEDLLKEIRAEVGGRRGKKKRNKLAPSHAEDGPGSNLAATCKRQRK